MEKGDVSGGIRKFGHWEHIEEPLKYQFYY